MTENLKEPDVPSAPESKEAERNGETESYEVIQVSGKPPSLMKALAISILIVIFLTSIALNLSVIKNEESFSSNVPLFHWVVVIGALLIAVIGLGISFWLYYVRAIYLKDGPALVPEKWGMIISSLIFETRKSKSETNISINSLIKASQYHAERSDTLLESFLTLQQAISNRDEEIKILKKGYEGKIFGRFLLRFIKISIAVDKIQKEKNAHHQDNNLSYIARLIENALEECGVSKIIPTLGVDYRSLNAEVADNPEVVTTEDESLNFMIASVESPAYVVDGEGSRDVIIPATVTIYKNI